MADTFDDLDALVAQGSDGKTLFRIGRVWSYLGAPRPTAEVSNIRLPSPNVPHARVQAALDAGAWVASRIDLDSAPRAVVKADPGGKPTRALGPQAFGAVEAI